MRFRPALVSWMQSRAAFLGAMVLTREEEDELSLWRSTVETLLERGVSPAEAIDGANLVARAYRRRLEESAARSSPDAANDVGPMGARESEP